MENIQLGVEEKIIDELLIKAKTDNIEKIVVGAVIKKNNLYLVLRRSSNEFRQFNFIVEVSNDEIKLNPQEHDWYTWIELDENTLSHYNISNHTKSILREASKI